MKKVIPLALALLMVCSMSVTAFAATTTLTTTVPEATYTLNIPANQEIPFGTTETSIGNVTVTESNGFALGKNLEVTVTYDAFTATGITTQIPYTLSLYGNKASGSNHTEELASGDVIIFRGTTGGTVEEKTVIEYANDEYTVGKIMFAATSEDWGKALAGEYSTTITFTAEVVAE